MNWSKEQEKAIEHSTAMLGSAIVSAAAGSGKTAMLVERIIRLITDESLKIPADKIIAVTFTNDAAGELKTRLEAALSGLLEKAENNEWLSEQLINLESAQICTISSFCINLIREYAEELGLKPDFKICEGAEREVYSEKALQYALDILYETFNDDEKKALALLTGEAGNTKLSAAISELYKEYEKQPFPEEWFAEKTAFYAESNHIKNTGIYQLKQETEAEIITKSKACLTLVKEALCLSYSDKMLERLETDKLFAESFINGKRTNLTYGNSKYGNVSGENKQALEEIKALRNRYIPEFKDMIISAGMLYDFDFIVSRQKEQVNALAKLFNIYLAEFVRLKQEANCVDFSDAEHYCLELLQNHAIAGKIKEEFYEIIVDEFQDSNAVQYAIFQGLSRNDSTGLSGNNLFFVGDVKQSIYRFRNADQRVFTSVAENKNFTALTLNKNYRSSQEVVDGVNKIFENTMTKETGGVNYDSSVRLIADRGSMGADYKAELVIIEAGEEQNKKQAEADVIAGRIKQMVQSKFEVAEKNGERRPCRYGDFAVIISALGTVEEEFSAAFDNRQIPYDKQKSGDYTEVAEIKTILALLTVIDRPFEDMALLNVLMSPLYRFTAEEIAAVCAEARRNNDNGSLFNQIHAYKNQENQSFYEKTQAFISDFNRWASYIKNAGACKLIRFIYDEGVFNPLAAASINPEKTMVNIRLLLHYAERLKSLSKDNLSGLIEALSENKASLEEARFSADDLSADGVSGKVKLMTIHASKGLEFPICFVARTGSKFNLRENYADIIFNDRIGFAFRYIIPETRTRCDTLIHKKVREENKAAAVSEEIRKLYVACTRARDKLILTAVTEEGKALENTYLYWLLQTDIKKTTVKADSVSPRNEAKIGIEIISARNKDAETQTREIISAINKEYPRDFLTKIPRRVTATQIGERQNSFESADSSPEQDEPTIFPRGPSFLGNKKLTGKKRGDAYHKMMELLDFSAGDYKKQMEAHKIRFTEEEFNSIDAEKIIAFFESDLGKRASASAKICKEFKLSTEISLSEFGCPESYDEIYKNKPFVQGIADMFFYEDDGIILLDYKTNRNTTPEKLIEQYSRQLDIYAKAIKEMTGEWVKEKWIYSFEVGGINLK
ncbi:MAG: UvrD-helicase domain-containing protein [Oscillospiraceae bacterium]|nr:UvrD-helicase domain-containing protein [Oscillospiraceae bacterium]